MAERDSLARRENGSELVSTPLPSTVTVHPAHRRGDFFEWEQYVRVLQKHWRVAMTFTLIVTTIVTVVTFRMTSIYEPSARLEIDPPGSDVFSLKDILNAASNDQDYLETQAQILGSDELAIDVIRFLRLDQNVEFVGKMTAEELSEQQTGPSASVTQLTPLEHVALRSFIDRLTVERVRNSRLVKVSFASEDAKLAARIVNTLVNRFIDRNYRTRYEATMQASEWLTGQLSDLRQKVEKSNQALVDYQRQNGIVDVDEKQNTVTQKVEDLNKQLTQAQADRIQLEAYLKLVEAGDTSSLPQIRDDVLLQSLTQRYVDARGQLVQAEAIYGRKSDNVRKLQNEVAELEVQCSTEEQRIIAGIRTSYQAARTREQLMTKALDQMKGLVGQMNEKMIQYNVLRNEAQANAELYNALLGRLKEAGISAGLKSSNIRVVDQARVLDRPTRPHRRLNIAIGFILGLLGGVALAFLKESLDNTVHTPDDVTQWTGLPSLAMFPMIGSINGNGTRRRLPAVTAALPARTDSKPSTSLARRFFLDRPKSAEAEAVRSLHTSIMLSRPGKPPQVILVVSPSPKEGKTTVAINLAVVYAQHGKTCLIDADLRRPTVARTFGISAQQGLSNVLTGAAELESVLVPIPEVPNLSVLPVGPIPPNPGELVASEPMRDVVQTLRKQFEFMVVDSPPIIPFADARTLSSLTDGVVLVGRCRLTTRQAIIRSTEMLSKVYAPVLGFVLNALDVKSPDYRYYQYGYSGYRYGYGYKYGYYGYDDSESGKTEPEDDAGV